MKKSIFLVMSVVFSYGVQASNLPPVAVLSVTPDRTWFYNAEEVVFDYYDSYDPEYYIVDRRWYINGVLQGPNTYEYSKCFVLYGNPVGDCYELPQGETTVDIKLGVKDVEGVWDYDTKTYTIQQHKGRKYFVKDHLGNIRTTVNRDGNVLGHDDYYPFGLTMPGRSSNSANPNDAYKFTGYELDDEAGLDIYHANARGYDPVLGRFMQIDPLSSERAWLTPYNYVQNNPLNRIDPTGMLDTWGFNSETGEVQWLNDAGGSETQYIQVHDGEGKYQKTVEVEGDKAYIGGSSDGWVVSGVNLWEGLSANYNSNSGYEYSASDLKTRYALMNSDGPLFGEVTKREAGGNAGPINAAEYVNEVGQFTGRLQNFSNFFGMISEVSAPNMKVRRSMRGQIARSNILAGTLNSSGASVSSLSSAGLRLQAAGSNLNTWQIYLKNTKGTYTGLGQGRNWVQSALQDYKRIMNQ